MAQGVSDALGGPHGGLHGAFFPKGEIKERRPDRQRRAPRRNANRPSAATPPLLFSFRTRRLSFRTKRTLTPTHPPLPIPTQAAFVVLPFLLILLSRPGYMPWSKGQFVLFVTFWASVAGATVCLLLQVRAAGEGTSSPFLVKTNQYCYQQARGV